MDENEVNNYLIFEAGRQLYATSLMSVREVIAPINTNPVPNTKEYFLGLVDIRGEIISVIDLCLRNGLTSSDDPCQCFLISETDHGAMAILVDKIHCVEEIAPEEIEENRELYKGISSDHLIGISKYDNKMLSIIDIKALLNDESKNLKVV